MILAALLLVATAGAPQNVCYNEFDDGDTYQECTEVGGTPGLAPWGPTLRSRKPDSRALEQDLTQDLAQDGTTRETKQPDPWRKPSRR